MKIAFFHELHAGGARRSVIEFAKELKKKHTIDLFTVDSKKNNDEFKNFHSVYFYPFSAKEWKGNNWRGRVYKDTIELFKLFLLHKKIAKKINDNTYDFVFIHPSMYTQAPFLLKFVKGNTIYYCQEPLRLVYDNQVSLYKGKDSIRNFYEHLIRNLRKTIDRTNINNAKKILANSYNTKKNIYKAYALKSEVCYLGVDSNYFNPPSFKKDIDILFIGSKNNLDGYDLFEEVINKLKNRKVQIIDSHKQRISDDKLRTYYQRSKLVLCLSHNEPFGLIPLEAAACECVVLAVDEGGFRESVIHNQTGFLFPRDSRKIASKINFLLNHPEKIREIGKYAHENVKIHWTWKKSAENLLSLVQR